MAIELHPIEYTRDALSEFRNDLINYSKDGTVPIYLANVADSGDEGLGVCENLSCDIVAVSVGQPIDPAELKAAITKYKED